VEDSLERLLQAFEYKE